MKKIIAKILKKNRVSDIELFDVQYILSFGEKRTFLKKTNVGEVQEQFVKELEEEVEIETMQVS